MEKDERKDLIEYKVNLPDFQNKDVSELQEQLITIIECTKKLAIQYTLNQTEILELNTLCLGLHEKLNKDRNNEDLLKESREADEYRKKRFRIICAESNLFWDSAYLNKLFMSFAQAFILQGDFDNATIAINQAEDFLNNSPNSMFIASHESNKQMVKNFKKLIENESPEFILLDNRTKESTKLVDVIKIFIKNGNISLAEQTYTFLTEKYKESEHDIQEAFIYIATAKIKNSNFLLLENDERLI